MSDKRKPKLDKVVQQIELHQVALRQALTTLDDSIGRIEACQQHSLEDCFVRFAIEQAIEATEDLWCKTETLDPLINNGTLLRLLFELKTLEMEEINDGSSI